jgi:hypothetical protein
VRSAFVTLCLLCLAVQAARATSCSDCPPGSTRLDVHIADNCATPSGYRTGIEIGYAGSDCLPALGCTQATDSQGYAGWCNVLSGNYFIEAYNSAASPFSGRQYWQTVHDLVVSPNACTGLAMIRKQPQFDCTVASPIYFTALGSEFNLCGAEMDAAIVANVVVNNRSNNPHYVRIKLALTTDTTHVPTVFTSGMAQIPARSSATLAVNFNTESAPATAGTYFYAVAIETRYPVGDPDRPIIYPPDGDDWTKTDSTDWLCTYYTPTLRSTWGNLKSRYR